MSKHSKQAAAEQEGSTQHEWLWNSQLAKLPSINFHFYCTILFWSLYIFPQSGINEDSYLILFHSRLQKANVFVEQL